MALDEGAGKFGIIKVLVVEPGCIHIRLYKERFTECPNVIDTRKLSLSRLGDPGDIGIGHLPMEINTFLEKWKVHKIASEEVHEDELQGYYYWRDHA